MFNSDANRLKQTFIWTFLILCIWEFASRTGLVNTDILPPCTKVLQAAVRELVSGKLFFQIVNSLYIVLLGFLISFVIAVFVTLGCVYSKLFESFFMTLCTLFNPLPGIVDAP